MERAGSVRNRARRHDLFERRAEPQHAVAVALDLS